MGGVLLHHFLFGVVLLRYELFSMGGGHPDRTNRGGITNTGPTLWECAWKRQVALRVTPYQVSIWARISKFG